MAFTSEMYYSLDGLFFEIGPMRFHASNTLDANPWAWTERIDVLFCMLNQ
jgi:carboxypeptidase C (cathepsin A)